MKPPPSPKTKLKCDMCNFICKKVVTLNKHKNTYQDLKTICDKGKFWFVLDVIPGKEKYAVAMRLDWQKEMKDREQSKKKYS